MNIDELAVHVSSYGLVTHVVLGENLPSTLSKYGDEEFSSFVQELVDDEPCWHDSMFLAIVPPQVGINSYHIHVLSIGTESGDVYFHNGDVRSFDYMWDKKQMSLYDTNHEGYPPNQFDELWEFLSRDPIALT